MQLDDDDEPSTSATHPPLSGAPLREQAHRANTVGWRHGRSAHSPAASVTRQRFLAAAASQRGGGHLCGHTLSRQRTAPSWPRNSTRRCPQSPTSCGSPGRRLSLNAAAYQKLQRGGGRGGSWNREGAPGQPETMKIAGALAAAGSARSLLEVPLPVTELLLAPGRGAVASLLASRLQEGQQE